MAFRCARIGTHTPTIARLATVLVLLIPAHLPAAEDTARLEAEIQALRDEGGI